MERREDELSAELKNILIQTLKSLTGKTLLLSVDGMFHVLSGLKGISIIKMDPKQASKELENFYRYLLKHKEEFDNVVIDNLSTFQKFWLNEMAKATKNGTPELRDYAIIDRVLLDFVAGLKSLEKNVLLFAHEKKVEIIRDSGGVYTQSQPDLRNMDAIMGMIMV